MKVQIEYDMKTRVTGFLNFLKERVEAPEHAAVKDIVADFVDKFLVAEIRRLEATPDMRTADVEVPDSVLAEPLRQAKAALDAQFESFLTGKFGVVEVKPAPEVRAKPEVQRAPALEEPEPKLDGAHGLVPSAIAGKTTKDLVTPRSKNGHVAMKKRDLADAEKDMIRSKFMELDGQIYDDACLPIQKQMDSAVTIFQVVGFVSFLHGQVARGLIRLRDAGAYETMLMQHRAKYAAYASLAATRLANLAKQP